MITHNPDILGGKLSNNGCVDDATNAKGLLTDDVSKYYKLLLSRTLDKLRLLQDGVQGNKFSWYDDSRDSSCWLRLTPAVLQIDGNWVVVMRCEIGGISDDTEYRLSDQDAQTSISSILRRLEIEPISDSESVGMDGYIGSDLEKHFFYFSIERPLGGHARFLPSAFEGLPADSNGLDLMPVGPSEVVIGDEIEAMEFLQYIRPFIIKKDWITLVGGLATRGKTVNDIDLIVQPIHWEQLLGTVKYRLGRGIPPSLAFRLSYPEQEKSIFKGPISSSIPLGDLVFLPRSYFEVVRQDEEGRLLEARIEQLRSAPAERKAEAETSKKLNEISISRFFYPMKPMRGAVERQILTIEGFAALVDKQKRYSWLISKKFDGNTAVIFKDSDSVRIYSDDGLENTANLPSIVSAVKELSPQSLIMLAEMELWIDGVHYPREAVRQAMTSRKEYEPFLLANIFELVYINGRDIHRLDAERRLSVLLSSLGKQIGKIDDNRTERLNIIPQYKVSNKGNLIQLTKKLSDISSSEGAVVKRSSYSLDGKAKLTQAIKFHKSGTLRGIIYDQKKTKDGNANIFSYGLPAESLANGLSPSKIIEVAGKPIMPLGKTFATSLEGTVGDVIKINFETMNLTERLEDKTFLISLWVPNVISISPSGIPQTPGEAIEIAKNEGILREKWVVGKEIYYDFKKVPLPPPSEIEKASRARVLESLDLCVKSYINSPHDLELIGDFADALGLPQRGTGGGDAYHLTIAVFWEVVTEEELEEISAKLKDIDSFIFQIEDVELFGIEKSTLVLVGKVPPVIERLHEELKSESAWEFRPHITFGFQKSALTLGDWYPDLKSEYITDDATYDNEYTSVNIDKIKAAFESSHLKKRKIEMSAPTTEIKLSEETSEVVGENPYLLYPEGGKTTKVMRHLHARGKSVHFDVRRQLNEEELVGWTENVQRIGEVETEVDTLEQARKLMEGYDSKRGNAQFKPMITQSKLVIEEKAKEPMSWFSFEGVTEPGTVGATKENEGVLLIVDEGETDWGSQKPSFHEYFDWGGKIFNGRYIARQQKDVWGITKEKTVWFGWYADDLLPYVLSARAMKQGWMPSDGQSALPASLQKVIPAKYRYWENKDAKKMRDSLVESKLITSDNLTTAEDGQIVLITPPPIQKKENEEMVPVVSSEGIVKIRKGEYRFVKRDTKKNSEYVLMMKAGKLFKSFHLQGNEKEKEIFLQNKSEAEMPFRAGMNNEVNIFKTEGEVPSHSLNGNLLPVTQVLLQQGKMVWLISMPSFQAFEFDNEINLIGVANQYGGKLYRLLSLSDGELKMMKPSVRFETDDIDKVLEKVWTTWAEKKIKNGIIIQQKIDGVRAMLESDSEGNITVNSEPEKTIEDSFERRAKELLKENGLALDVEFDGRSTYVLSVLRINNVDISLAAETDRLDLVKKSGLIYPISSLAFNKDTFQRELKKVFALSSEGVMLKAADSQYRFGETDEWAKIRRVSFKECIISKKVEMEKSRWVYTLMDSEGNLFTAQPSGKELAVGDKVIVAFPIDPTEAPRIVE